MTSLGARGIRAAVLAGPRPGRDPPLEQRHDGGEQQPQPGSTNDHPDRRRGGVVEEVPETEDGRRGRVRRRQRVLDGEGRRQPHQDGAEHGQADQEQPDEAIEPVHAQILSRKEPPEFDHPRQRRGPARAFEGGCGPRMNDQSA